MKKLIKGMKKIFKKESKRNIIEADDCELVKEVKKNFNHFERLFIHGSKEVFVDCIYAQATPGVIENVLLDLNDRIKIDPLNNKILNLGGGTDQITSILKYIGFDVYNLDIEVKDEDERNKQFDLNSNENLPYGQKYFDYVLCQEVIEHIENPWKLLRQIKTVLKDNGILILTTPNIQSLFSKKEFAKSGFFRWFTPDCFSYHINPIPKWEIELIAEKEGFSIEKVAGNGDYYFKSEHLGADSVIDNNEVLIFIMKNR